MKVGVLEVEIKEGKKMQRLLSLKVASNLNRKLSNSSNSTTSSLSNSHPYKTFASFSKPPAPKPHSQSQNYNSHSWRSQHNLPAKLHGFLSNPLLAKRFLDSSNTLLRTLPDCRIFFLRSQLPNRSFELDPAFRSFQRNW